MSFAAFDQKTCDFEIKFINSQTRNVYFKHFKYQVLSYVLLLFIIHQVSSFCGKPFLPFMKSTVFFVFIFAAGLCGFKTFGIFIVSVCLAIGLSDNHSSHCVFPYHVCCTVKNKGSLQHMRLQAQTAINTGLEDNTVV